MNTPRFDLAEVPKARLVIEASAGTGKTHALAGLAVHLLGRDEVTVERLLVVTYTRMATAELRGRIRSMLTDTLIGLDAEVPDPGVAEIVGALRGWDPEAARCNLQRALSGYDAIAVTTIHGFAQRALASFGSVAGIDPDFEVLADSSRIIEDAASDVFAVAAAMLAEQATAVHAPDDDVVAWRDRLPKSAGAVVKTAKLLDGISDLLLLPDVASSDLDTLRDRLGDPDTPPAMNEAALAKATTTLVERRRHRAGLRSYEELLRDLRSMMDGPAGAAVTARLSAQFTTALIDEFQDTDRVQWDIFDRCFGRDGTRLILVGDPKQAIYGFRGANVHTYAEVVGRGDAERRVLATNWRSDGELLRGLEALWTGAVFGDGVAFEPVGPAPGRDGTRLRRDDGEPIAPLEVALADTGSLADGADAKNLSKSVADKVIARYVVDHVVDLLTHGRLADSADDASPRPIRPDDIALLTRINTEAAALSEALQRAGVPAVVQGKGDVRLSSASRHSQKDRPSRAATEWRLFLDALADPADTRLVRAASVGVFGPLASPVDLVAFDEGELTGFQRQLSDWAATLGHRGPPGLIGRLWAESPVLAKVLGGSDGDRLMTDLEHLGEIFAVEVGTGPVSPDRLLAVLPAGAGGELDGADRITARRIPTGAAAVTIMTVHNSKGLEFPIVGCVGMQKIDPSRADRSYDRVAHRQVIDLEKSEAFKEGAKREQREENLRLLYVALTRAVHHTFTCWTHERNSPSGSLTRLLFARDETGAIDQRRFAEPKVSPPTPDDALELLGKVADTSADALAVRSLDRDWFTGPSPMWTVPAGTGRGAPGGDVGVTEPDASDLGVATLGRTLDRRSGRWSFTTITARRDAAGPGAGPGDADGDVPAGSGGDEGQPHHEEPLVGVESSPEASAAVVSDLAWLPAGTAFGTLIHAVLEGVDFAASELSTEVGAALARQLNKRPLSLTPIRRVEPLGPRPAVRTGEQLCVDGLVGALRSPLGSLWGGRRLCDVGLQDRLSECTFDLRLEPSPLAAVTPSTIGSLAREHLGSHDPYAAWADELARGRLDLDLVGHLTGSIDLVTRIDVGGTEKFVVSDYKTNRLHAAGQPPGPDDYGPEALVDAMVEHDYPLQALLYSVALHRYLRWRLQGYDPARDLGGVTYLFLRGMTPDPDRSADEPAGVATWDVPSSLVEALDALFAGRKGPS